MKRSEYLVIFFCYIIIFVYIIMLYMLSYMFTLERFFMILEVVGLGLVQMVASEVSFEYFDQ